MFLIPELTDQWKSDGKFTEFLKYDEINKFRNFGGIRNEEDFVMTDKGAQVLGKPKPMSIEEIEAIRAEV